MDIRAALLKEHSKKQTLLITTYIGDNQERFNRLMYLFFNDEYRVVQRAAWVMGHCADNHQELMLPHLSKMVAYMTKEGVHGAVRRNVVRVLTQLDIPEELMGLVADACFSFLANPKEAVAVKVHSMEVLYRFCKQEPDLANELKLLIEENMEHGTAGIRSRGRRILKKLG